MRIGFFTDTYRPQINGITYVIDIMRKDLEAMGHEVFIFAPALPGYEETDDHIIRFPALKGFFYDDYMLSLFFPPQEIRKIREYNLDIVQFFTPSQVGLLGCAVAKKYDLPLISQYSTDLYEYVSHYPSTLPGIMALLMFVAPFSVTPRTSDFTALAKTLRPRRQLSTWSKELVRTTCTLLHNHCDAVIALSKKKEDQLREWGTTAPLYRIPTGVDEIKTTKDAVAAFKKKWKITPKDEVVLFVGRLAAEKNLDLLIDAFEVLAKKRPHAKLVMVGDFDYKPALEAHAATTAVNDRVVFTGAMRREDLGCAYQSAKVFAFPSQTDTQGLVLHEAANAGTPLVIIDKEVSEMVISGKTGYFAENTAEGLAASINKVLALPADDYKKMSKAAKARALEFGEREQTTKYVALYQRLLQPVATEPSASQPKATS